MSTRDIWAALKRSFGMKCAYRDYSMIVKVSRAYQANGNLIPLKLIKYDRPEQMKLLSNTEYRLMATYASEHLDKEMCTLLVERCEAYDIPKVRLYDSNSSNIYVYNLEADFANYEETSSFANNSVMTGVTASMSSQSQDEQLSEGDHALFNSF